MSNLLRGHQQIISIALGSILASKFLTFSSLHTMIFNHGAVKTCADKLLAHVTFNILAISLTIHNTNLKTQINLLNHQRQIQEPATCKIVSFVTIVNTLNEYTVSQLQEDVIICVHRIKRKYITVNQLFFCFLFSFCQFCTKITLSNIRSFLQQNICRTVKQYIS